MKRDLLPIISVGLLLSMVCAAIGVLLTGTRPDTQLLGSWEEVSCTYEKMDPTPLDVTTGMSIGQELRNEITKGLVIHGSETWNFEPGAALVLQKNSSPNDTLQWKLKGHGRMLELVYGDQHQEVYKVRELKDDQIVLQFNNDMIARGVVSIILKRSIADA